MRVSRRKCLYLNDGPLGLYVMTKAQQLDSRLRNIGLGLEEFKWDSPVIGISGNFRDGNCMLAKAYYQSVLEAGGVPVIIPPFDSEGALSSLLDTIDGLVFSGGADIDPDYFGQEPLDMVEVNEERDLPELMMLSMAMDRQIPILGICRGMQLMAVGLGGEMYQDIKMQHGQASLEHSQHTENRFDTSHEVKVVEDSLLSKLLGTGTIRVNSFHHQAVSRVPQGFVASALAPDGIIEAMESACMRPMLAVQWHPESFILNGDRCMMPLFSWLSDRASLFRHARRVHMRSVTLDSHQDCPMFFDKGSHFFQKNPGITVEWDYVGETSPDGNSTFSYNPLVDLHKMKYGQLDAAFMVAYLKQLERDDDSLKAATVKADRLLDLVDERIGECAPFAAIATSPQELLRNRLLGVKSIVKGIENGYAIGKDLSRLEHFRQRGVAYMTLCHNGDNDICGSARGEGEHGGLTHFGRDVVREMNRLGMMVDLSHASERSFYDALELSTKPIICSHSSSRLLCDHPRNLTDAAMKDLAVSGGVAQVCLYSGFLKKDGQATVDDAVRHIIHMIEVMGPDHVGIGSDFDGGGGMPGLEDASWMTSLTVRLLEEGLSDDVLAKLWGLNFLAVWQKNLD